MNRKVKIDTLLQHSGYSPEQHRGHLNEPLYQDVAVKMPSCGEAARRFNGKGEGFIYSRHSNDTVQIFENRVAALEGGQAALAYSSGLAAIQSLVLRLVRHGGCLISQRQVYGGTSVFFTKVLPTLGREAVLIGDIHNPKAWQDTLEKNRKRVGVVFMEMPANPTVDLVDLEMVAGLARNYKVPLVVDSTFATPVLLRPLEHGANFVVHSATKYMTVGGSNLAGVIVGPKDFLKDLRNNEYMISGAPLSPFDAWLCLMGLKTLRLRVLHQSASAKELANYLATMGSRVSRIYYPTHQDERTWRLAKKYLPDGCGAVLAFEYRGSRRRCVKFIERLKIFSLAANLGDTRSLVIHPASTTHSRVDAEGLKLCGISETLIRMSVGLEDIDDLKNDLEQAFYG